MPNGWTRTSTFDKDEHFRNVIARLNEMSGGGYRTISSCQGHAPGKQYAHVQETMVAYITVQYISPSMMGEVETMFRDCPHFSHVTLSSSGITCFIGFADSVRDHWSEVDQWVASYVP